MKPEILHVSALPDRSFSLRQDFRPNINNRWHCHKEVELIQFHRGSGTQFVGDDIRRFSAGDIVLVGADLPHYWHFDQEESTENEHIESPYSTVIHFTENFWGDSFLQLPENALFKNVLEKARRGLNLKGNIGEKIAPLIQTLSNAEGPYRLILLMECLIAASQISDDQFLASMSFQYNASEFENQRLNAIYDHTLKHFDKKISLPEIASVAGLSANSFCRYFKSRTGKQYSEFLVEIRIGHACKMLINNTMTTKQICYESGFNNFTCFYKKFKRITGKTPLQYQQSHVKN